ncbi:MAG: transglutaminase family protein, partial [Myxococcota bacterium]
MRIRLRHHTQYHYPEPAGFGPHYIRLRPADHARARLLAYNLEISPEAQIRWQQDPWGNRIARVTFDDESQAQTLSVTVDASFDVRPVNPFDFFIDARCEELSFEYPDGLAGELAPFLKPPTLTPRLAAFIKTLPTEGRTIDFLVELTRKVAREVNYVIRNEPGLQTSEETLTIASGSCRDSAVLLVDALRARGLAARFVSGYLVQLTDEGNIPDEAKGVDQDVVDLHAWAEVYIPGGGWIGLDGTSGLLTGEGHIPLAGTVQPALAGPIEGTSSVGADRLDFSMEVARLGHEPRPRRPYTDDQWATIQQLGRRVDASLSQAGLRMTMGGEPTWTSRLHPRKAEWNEEALGPTKWAQGLTIAHALLPRLAEGGVLLHRYGKLYPGESLPRWAMQLIWRPDGTPVWKDRSKLARGPGGDFDDGRTPPGGATAENARALLDAIVQRLGLPSDTAIAGYEDPWHFLTEEAHLPEDVDPFDADLDSPEERRRLARVLNRGMRTAVGYAFPLGRDASGWVSAPWTFRRQRMFLIPGDSPMGLRLPLDRMGGQPLASWSQDPSQLFDPLPEDVAIRTQSREASKDRSDAPSTLAPDAILSDGETVRTALCVEPRSGILHVFLPPVPESEHFLTLVAAIEGAASDVGCTVRLEGYPPPSDPRLRSCSVTPDPGVIEVNLPVTERFDDYVALMQTVADAANHSGLTPERFQLDGREVGPGGGHHLTLGGPSTPQSPFLARPALLAGLLRFFQNHPALSYLFTGQFVGATSQAPRIDEARHEALYELELALAQAEAAGGTSVPPWLTDRLFRNLLVDVTGNTHRSEISIDKLFDPNLPGGRQGIIEFRAFEMPPHEQMAVAQMLLVRGVVAKLAQQPYRRPLIRWGTQLHDRFMLPHFLWRDFEDVIRELADAGLPFDAELYRP